jgi:DNA-binding XRE family transcriptional regulator
MVHELSENTLALRRAYLGMSQAELAKRAGITQHALLRIEKGGACYLHTAYKILNALNTARRERCWEPLTLAALGLTVRDAAQRTGRNNQRA